MEAAGSATPDAFGPFRVLHQIGAGALGPVFRAYEPDRDRLVAVKVYRLGLPPERVHQLVAEFEQLIADGLAHPGIAAPVAAGIDGDAAYLAHDYVAADSLDVVVRDEGPARPADALRVGALLAGALDFATVVDINHGALHPRDVLVSQDEVRITGLGVTRALERIGVAAPVRRPYTAPERAAGTAWDRRADIFSLAALMHEMLWGRRISGTGTQAALTLTELAGGDLEALRHVFARALADDPDERFDKALAFAEALHEAFPGAGTAAPGPARRRAAPDTRRSFEEPSLPLDFGPPPADAFSSPTLDESSNAEAVVAQVFRPVFDEESANSEAAESLVASEEAVAQVASDSEAVVAQVVRPAHTDETVRYADIGDPPRAAEQPPEALMDPYQPEPVLAAERSRSLVWPLALALIVGLGLGFGGGFAVGMRDRSAPAMGTVSTPAPQPAAQQPGQEWTEGAVAEARRRPAATDKAAADRSDRLVPPASDATAGRLLISSRPAGARVFVDGRDRGQTPAMVPGLGRGAHRIRLVRDGYSTEERRVVITGSTSPQSMAIALTRTPQPSIPAPVPAAAATTAPFVGALSVDSRPQGAAVFIDGKLAGATPLNVAGVPAGEHAVRLEREGYRRWTASVRVVASGQNRVTASLEH